jgi:hypothetical protein
VPLIIRYPSRLKPERIDSWFSTVDLGRVILALIETTPSAGPDPANAVIASVGRRERHFGEYGNPVKMLRGSLGADAERIGLERFDRTLWFVLADGLKLVYGSDGTRELYDLTRDFDESTDLAAVRPDAVSGLERDLETWRESVSRHRSSPGLPVLDDETTHQLEALGYVSPGAAD